MLSGARRSWLRPATRDCYDGASSPRCLAVRTRDFSTRRGDRARTIERNDPSIAAGRRTRGHVAAVGRISILKPRNSAAGGSRIRITRSRPCEWKTGMQIALDMRPTLPRQWSSTWLVMARMRRAFWGTPGPAVRLRRREGSMLGKSRLPPRRSAGRMRNPRIVRPPGPGQSATALSPGGKRYDSTNRISSDLDEPKRSIGRAVSGIVRLPLAWLRRRLRRVAGSGRKPPIGRTAISG